MSLVAQWLRGSGPVPRSKSRFRLKAAKTRFVLVAVWSAATVQSGEPRAAHIAAVHASAGPSTPPGHQSPGWRRAARVQENEAEADGTLPAEGWGAQPAPRHCVFVCVADFSDMLGGILHTGVPQRPNTSSRAASPCTGCCTPTPTPPASPPTLRPPSARLAARHPPPAAPTGPPMPLDSEDPVMLQQLQVFCMYFANSNFLTPYNQLQRRPALGRSSTSASSLPLTTPATMSYWPSCSSWEASTSPVTTTPSAITPCS
ncbi:hypothetical protein HaLaN_13299 [Haematococcus lacustris]|uniref:Uncharacterized protein n=1 Tax=Haematococcus lacustris TaxID=44745 RepID=A0A699ZLZ2_HAELA|nr:hypothetical protein HaLaN_13299 [Haematococcus lacustris]